jgi:hypothetical protein
MNARTFWAIAVGLVMTLVVGCGATTTVDPKPAGPPDTRLKPAENGKSTPSPAPAIRGD